MNVLYTTHFSWPYVDPAPLADRQIICGPGWSVNISPEGSLISMPSPSGTFDAAQIARQIPRGQTPDLFVAYVDTFQKCWPTNTAVFPCPRVALVGDVHHGPSPIRTVLRYLLAETFDAVFLIATRRTAKWLRAAGVGNVGYCGPAVLIRPFAGAFRHQRENIIGFAGQAGQYHPRRQRIIASLAEASLPIKALRAPQPLALEMFSRSLVTLNCSLNGDVNMRCFEALSAGAMLLSDRLSAESGFPFKDGEELVCYDSAEDLAEKARYYLANPRKALMIAQAGYKAVKTRHPPSRKIAQILAAASGKKWDRSLIVDDVSLSAATEKFGPRLACYEHLQELHRVVERAEVLYMPDVARFADDVKDLLRLRLAVAHRDGMAWDCVVAGEDSYRDALAIASPERIVTI